jgi:hypothetical protein
LTDVCILKDKIIEIIFGEIGRNYIDLLKNLITITIVDWVVLGDLKSEDF